jgi:apolipoprotein N-acyltransferase
VTAFGIFRWLFEVPGFGMHHAVLLAVYVALYPATWCAGLSAFCAARLPLLVTAPALWVVLDYVRAHAGFLALPWASLAHSQYGNLAILQIATVTGEYGVTFLVVMASVAIADLIVRRTWRSVLIAGIVIGLAHAAGALALARPDGAAPLQVAVVQPNIHPDERRTAESREATLDRLERLTRVAAASRPAVIVWPETAVWDLSRDPALVKRLHGLAVTTETPLIVGASEVVKFAPKQEGIVMQTRSHNSAYFVEPGRPLAEPYRKMRLVPFAEYRPLEEIVRWPEWLVPRVHAMTPGEVRQQFTLDDGTRIGVLICWENLFADFVRPAVGDGAQLLVQLTNDAWFGRTAASRQHNLASVLRAVENRTPVVIASNTGPSQIIDPYGRVVATVPTLFGEGMTSADITLGVGGTPYTRMGDLYVLAAAAGLVLAVTSAAVRGFVMRRAGARPGAGARPVAEPTHHQEV